MSLPVREIIKRFGSQQRLADALGVSRQTVKVWCTKNEVSSDYVVQFCNVTGCKPEEIPSFAADVIRLSRASRRGH